RDQVGVGEVAVVLRLLLAPPRGGGAGVLVEVPGLLHHAPARGQHPALAFDLVAYGTLDRAQRVDVLGLGPGPPLRGAARHQRDVDVAAQRALLHAHVGDAEGADQVAQFADVGAGHQGGQVAGVLDGLGDDLQQRNTRAVVVDGGVLGAVDAAGGPADVRGLAGVLLHVDPFDVDPELARPVRGVHR